MTYPDPSRFQQPGTPYPAPGAPYLPGFPGVPEGPLGDLQNQVAGVLNSADSHHTYLPRPDGSMLAYPHGRQRSALEDAAIGGAIGFGSWLVWRRMQRRRAAKGEWTSPGYRCLFLFLLPPVIGFALSMIWVAEAGWFLGLGTVTGIVLATVYAAYRASGHGKYNSRRRGSPWRADHRRR